jgi:hypothetical protein
MAIITDPDWIDPEETTFDVEKPIRSEQGIMLAGNVIAAFQGKPGAPKLQGKALDIGIGNLSGTTAIVGLDDVASLLLVASANKSENTSTFITVECRYKLTTDGGSSWGSSQLLATGSFAGVSGSSLYPRVTGATIVNMTGYNGIRLEGGSGCAIWVKGE